MNSQNTQPDLFAAENASTQASLPSLAASMAPEQSSPSLQETRTPTTPYTFNREELCKKAIAFSRNVSTYQLPLGKILERLDEELQKSELTAFCRRSLDIGYSQARHLIQAVEIAEIADGPIDIDNFKPEGRRLVREALCRPLFKLKGRPDELRKVVAAAEEMAKASGGQILVEHVKTALKSILGEKSERKTVAEKKAVAMSPDDKDFGRKLSFAQTALRAVVAYIEENPVTENMIDSARDLLQDFIKEIEKKGQESLISPEEEEGRAASEKTAAKTKAA